MTRITPPRTLHDNREDEGGFSVTYGVSGNPYVCLNGLNGEVEAIGIEEMRDLARAVNEALHLAELLGSEAVVRAQARAA